MKRKKIIVFLHHFGGDLASWQWLVKRLHTKCTCIALTLPGFGNKDHLKNISIPAFADWVNDQVALLELEEYILCGHGLGAKIALYASRINDINPPSKIIAIAPLPIKQPETNLQQFQKYTQGISADKYPQLLRQLTYKDIKKPVYNHTLQAYSKVHPDVINWYVSTGYKEDISILMNGNSVPSFIITSKRDPLITPKLVTKEILPYLDNAKLLTFGRSGHLIPLESPRKLSRYIRKVLNY